MAVRKRKSSAQPAVAEAEAPAEGTKGVIWGQQVKKSKRGGWVEDLGWKDASPVNFDEFLMGAEEGGFMGLEELDGGAFDQLVGGPSTSKETKGKKKKTGQLEDAESKVLEQTPDDKVVKKQTGLETKGVGKSTAMASAEDESKLAGVNRAESHGAASEKKQKKKVGQSIAKGDGGSEADKKALPTKKKEKKAAAGKPDAAQLPKRPKMTSSEKKRRKRDKRRERQEQARSQRLDPGLFMGGKTSALDLEVGTDEVRGEETLERDEEAGELKVVPGGGLVLDGVHGGHGEKKLSRKERRKLKMEKQNDVASTPMEQSVSGSKDDSEGDEAREIGAKAKTPKGKVVKLGSEKVNGQTVRDVEQAGRMLESGMDVDGETSDQDLDQDFDEDLEQDSDEDLDQAERLSEGDMVADLDGDDSSDEAGDSDAEQEQNRRGSGSDAGVSDCDVSAWEGFGLHPLLLKGLSKLGFSQPTEIQRQCIPAALKQGKDLIGAAETGSGKTLAFGLPILNRLLQIEEKEKKLAEKGRPGTQGDGTAASKKGGSPLRALIMTPTRELALQVCSHLKAAAQETSIRIVPIVGGMAVPKQQRLLRSRPGVVVGTPGRLWELISQGEQHLLQVDDLRFFVLDEADRMVEKGHFQELQSIIDSLPKQGGGSPAESDPLDEEVSAEGIPPAKHAAQRQTFVFSATLMVPPSLKRKLKGAGKSPVRREESQVAALIKRAGLSRHAAIVDLTSDVMVASKLEEAVLECMDTEKDAYLYYLLKMHPSRTIVFCTAISAVRRIAALLQLLQIPSWALHAQLQQRQRFKAMDRFKKEPHGVLVATDVAARGLDIEGIRCVIHYQLPLSTEIYVHRSGRTARATSDGISVALVSPSERPKLNALCKALGREGGLADFPVDQSYMPAVLERVKLALKVDGALRQQQQVKAKRSWLEKHADELGIELDADELEEQSRTSKKGKVRIDVPQAPAPGDAKAIEAKLRALVRQPLQPRAMHHTYLAGSGITAETVKQLQQAVHRRGGSKAGAIGTPGEEALDALRKKRAKR